MFKDTLILWLAGFGLTEEQCKQICEDPRIAANIKRKDSGAMVQDLPGVLYYRYGKEGNEAYDALKSPAEALMLMMAFK